MSDIMNNMTDKKIKIAAIGGGTGLSTILRGLKRYPFDITAIVTVADDGGNSGWLRSDQKILPPGDIRNCILALAETEPLMEQLFEFRFKDGSLKGQNFGNLLLAAVDKISGGDFVSAVKMVSDVLKVKGRVLPVCDNDVELVATLENGVRVYGESRIGRSIHYYNSKISSVELRVKRCKNEALDEEIHILDEVASAIKEADIITLGPGSLYTSIMPNLVVNGMVEAINSSSAPVVYIGNIMTQPGETDGYSAFDHVDAIIKHTSLHFIDYCIFNCGKIPREYMIKYLKEGSGVVRLDRENFSNTCCEISELDLVSVTDSDHIRHNANALAEEILKIAGENEKIKCILHKN